MMEIMRYHIISDMIKRFDYKSYLEIGISAGNTWRYLECDKKVGVEPAPQIDDDRIFIGTSDQYFALHYTGTEQARNDLQLEERFDLIFIDGLHLADQVVRDIESAMDRLNHGGAIVVHDCNPPTEEYAGPRPELWRGIGRYLWCGTVWRGWVSWRMRNQHIFSCTVDTDYGVGIIMPDSKPMPKVVPIETFPYPITWEYFDTNRRKLLNLINTYSVLEELWKSEAEQ